jgi:hypothetical protein
MGDKVLQRIRTIAPAIVALTLALSAGPLAAAEDAGAAHIRCAKVADDYINSDSYKKAVGISFLFVGIAALNSDHDRNYKKHKCLVDAGIDPKAPDPNAAKRDAQSKPGTRSASGTGASSKGAPGRGGDCPEYMYTKTGRQCS